jgi:hypothetical protein
VKERNDENQPAPVAATPKQAGETRDRDPWWWVERCVWTEHMLTRLTRSEPANRVWYSLLDKTYIWFARRGLLSLAAEHEWTRTIVKLRTH